MKKLIIVAALLCVAGAASATTLSGVPVLSPQRASVAAGADYAFYSGSAAPQFPVKKEWQIGLFCGYKLTPTLALTAGTRYGVDSKQFDSKVGLRLLLWSGTGQ